ncbi:hypothetical protein D3C71_1838180 [compost metagenome]
MAQLDAVAEHVLLVALQVGAGPPYLAILGVAVAFHITVVALGVVVVQGVLQAGAVADPVVEDRTQPAYPLLVAAVGNVVVLEPAAVVDLHRAAAGEDG